MYTIFFYKMQEKLSYKNRQKTNKTSSFGKDKEEKEASYVHTNRNFL